MINFKLGGYLTLVGAVYLHLFAGYLFSWGNIQNYVISYFHYLGD